LFRECRRNAERGIAALEPDVSVRSQMQLCHGLTASLFQTKGPAPEITCGCLGLGVPRLCKASQIYVLLG
jgi:hypothetical protein